MWTRRSRAATELVKRADLLRALVEHVFENGLHDQSTNALAEALGTSTRMLIHYFDTLDDLRLEFMQKSGNRFRSEITSVSPESLQEPSSFISTLLDRQVEMDQS